MTDSTPWIKASASGQDTECVEMRRHDGLIEVRDSKDREGPVLRFTHAEFTAWLDGVDKGEFDHLT
jgi:Domain of unknown function (DUF397)